MIRINKTYTFRLISIFGVILAISTLFIQCSDKPGQQSSTTKVGKDRDDQTGISASDSLKALLDEASHDTIRLRIIELLAVADNNIEIMKAYNKQIDSVVQRTLATNPSISVKNSCLKYLATALRRNGYIYSTHGEYEKAIEYYTRSMKISEELGDKKGISNSLNPLGIIYYYQGNYETAQKYLIHSLELKEELGDKISISKALSNIGTVYADLGDFSKSLEYYKKGLVIIEEIGSKREIAYTINNIGTIYAELGDVPNALESYHRSLKINEEIADTTGISASLINLGNIYYLQKDYDKAMEYYLKSLIFREYLGDKREIAASLNRIGNIYIDKAKKELINDIMTGDSLFQKGLEYFRKSLVISEKIGNKKGISESLNFIGNIYSARAEARIKQKLTGNDSLSKKALDFHRRSLKISQELGDKTGICRSSKHIGDIYFQKDDIENALKYARESYINAKTTGNIIDIAGAAKLLEETHARQGNYKLSWEYLGEYLTMLDSINTEENTKLVQQKYYKYQYEKKAAYDSLLHSKAIEISNLEIAQQKTESRRQKLVIGFVTTGLLFVLVFAVFIFRSLRLTRKQKNIIEIQKKLVDEKNSLLSDQNEEIRTQRDEIENQRDEIMAQRDTVTEQKERIEYIHRELTSSIRYAERIQKAVLPSNEYISKITADSHLLKDEYFILFKPREVVSGDFYFFEKNDNMLYIAVADCTGHGVPGAFMSMLGISFLNEIIARDSIRKPAQVLDELRESIIRSLQQRGIEGEQKDGMDITLIAIDTKTRIVQFAGAFNPLYLIPGDTKELIEIKPDQMPVAIYENMKPFTNHEHQLKSGDRLYLASDGYGDQFGGPKGRKFMSKRFKELINENSNRPMAEQQKILETTLEDWTNNYGEIYEQTDDISIIGIKVA